MNNETTNGEKSKVTFQGFNHSSHKSVLLNRVYWQTASQLSLVPLPQELDMDDER
jgi:hypothetical protein